MAIKEIEATEKYQKYAVVNMPNLQMRSDLKPTPIDFDTILQQSIGNTDSSCPGCPHSRKRAEQEIEHSEIRDSGTPGAMEMGSLLLQRQREASRKYRLKQKEKWIKLGMERITLLNKRYELTLEANQLEAKVVRIKEIVLSKTEIDQLGRN